MQSTSSVAGVDKEVSELILGTAAYRLDGRDVWFSLLDAFMMYGGTTVDTARIYANGESEQLIGQWMESRGNRETVVVITKGGHGKDGALPRERFRETIEEEIRRSLEALRSDYIDLYLLHRDNPAIPVGEIIEVLNAERERGRIHAFGGSNWTYERVDEANGYATRQGLRGFTAVSNNLSLAVPTGPFYTGLVSTDPSGECWHIRTGIPLLAWSSQARGFFSGRCRPEMRNADHIEDGFTRRMIEIYGTDENFERLRRAEELGKRKGGYSAVEVALAWVLSKPFRVVPIVGPRTKQELESCVRALSIQLTASEIKWLNLEPRSRERPRNGLSLRNL